MVDIFLSDLDYNTPRCRKNIVCVESEVIGSDDSTFKLCWTCPVLRKLSIYSMYDVSLMATFI